MIKHTRFLSFFFQLLVLRSVMDICVSLGTWAEAARHLPVASTFNMFATVFLVHEFLLALGLL